MRVDGIFFDETPSQYMENKYEYLKTASQAVRNSTRFRDHFVGASVSRVRCDWKKHFQLTRNIVHNPGNITSLLSTLSDIPSSTAGAPSYLNLADITVIYEETFAHFLEKSTFEVLQNHKLKRSKLAVILHSLPVVSNKVLDFLVEQVEEAADWVFLTDVGVKDKYYHSFSGMFGGLVDAVD